MSIKTYEGLVTNLKENEIFCFGSNPVGFNGNPLKGTGGSALFALKNGWVEQNEKMDNRLSKCGKAWGITTVSYPGRKRSKTPDQIKYGIKKLYDYAENNPSIDFFIAYTGKGKNLNGYTNKELSEMFESFKIPDNIIFEKEFSSLFKNI